MSFFIFSRIFYPDTTKLEQKFGFMFFVFLLRNEYFTDTKS